MWFPYNPTNKQKFCFPFPIRSPVATCLFSINTQLSWEFSAVQQQLSSLQHWWKASSLRSSSLVEDGGANASCVTRRRTTSLFTWGICCWPTTSATICFTFYSLSLSPPPQQKPVATMPGLPWRNVDTWGCLGQGEVQLGDGGTWCLPWTARPAGSPNSPDDQNWRNLW